MADKGGIEDGEGLDWPHIHATASRVLDRECGCGHRWTRHSNLGCLAEVGNSGSGSVADAVFCRCDLSTPPTPTAGGKVDTAPEGTPWDDRINDELRRTGKATETIRAMVEANSDTAPESGEGR